MCLPTRPIIHCSQELKDHVIIMGYGRSGELIAQLLSENLIPFVAVDSSTNQVAKGKVSDELKPETVTKGKVASTFNYTALSAAVS